MFDNTQCNHNPDYSKDSTLDATDVTGRVECRVCHETMACPHPWFAEERWSFEEDHCTLCDLVHDPDAECRAAGHELQGDYVYARLWCVTCNGEEW